MVKNDVLGGGAVPDHAPPRLRWAATQLHLGLLATHQSATSGRFRSLGWSAALLATSGVLSIVLLNSAGAAEVADVLALRLLAYASWLYGGLGLSALLAPTVGDDGSKRISALRGSLTDAGPPWAFGLAVRIAAGVFVAALPGFVLAAIVAPSHAFASRLLLLPASLAYALGLGASLGAIGALSKKLSPQRPRWTAAGLILLPFFAAVVWPQVPSVPGFFGLLLGAMLRLGGAQGL